MQGYLWIQHIKESLHVWVPDHAHRQRRCGNPQGKPFISVVLVLLAPRLKKNFTDKYTLNLYLNYLLRVGPFQCLSEFELDLIVNQYLFFSLSPWLCLFWWWTKELSSWCS